ncbi:MAG: hypothetical protein GY771_16775 [bacterium]|nr:hypothetical protein [bacterium]
MKRILLISLTLTILLGVACTETTGPEPPTYFGLTPSQCIYYLEQAFNDRDIGIFEKQLSPNFIFYFNPSDVGENVGGYTIPSSWDFDHIRRAVWNMVRPYDEGGAYQITMDLPEGDVGDPPEGATTYTASNIGLSLLVMFDEENGLIVNKGLLEFVFEKADNDGEDYWRIKDWRDFTYSKKGIESASLGPILATFYAKDPLDPTR